MSFFLYTPARNAASSKRLERDEDVGEFQVSLLFQMCEHTRPEEDLALTDPEQVWIQLQGLDLKQYGTSILSAFLQKNYKCKN